MLYSLTLKNVVRKWR